MAAFDVVARFVADTSDLDRSVKGVGASMQGLAKTAAAAFAGSAFIKGAKEAVDAASNLSETLNKSNVIFGKNAKAIENWSKDSAKSFGLSQQQALDAAGSFGNLFTQVGLGIAPATKMSKSMVQLAGDFASFHNADITQVLEAQQAAFRGEYDALQRFVPTITAAAVEQEALAETGKSSTKELTAGEKAAATYTLMMDGAGKATGDFARTQDGAANQQRILSAEWENAKAKLGSAFLPVLQQLLPVVVSVVDAFSSLPPQLQALIVVGGGAAATLGPLVSGIGNLAKAASDTVGREGGLGKMVAFLAAGGPWVAVGALAVGAIVGITQALEEQAVQLDLNLQAFEKLNQQGLVALIGKLQDTGKQFGDTQVLNNAFNQVLEQSTVQAQRWIDAANAAGINTDKWSRMLDDHIRKEQENKAEVDASTKKIDERNAAIERTPAYKKTTFVIDTSGATPFALSGQIPGLAEGGIVTRPTLALIGERGPEAVVPLSGPGSGMGVSESTFNINVSVAAGMSPAAVGAEIVDQIRAYERVSGKAWRN